MRRFPSSWDRTLVVLGFRRRVKRIKRELHRRKHSRLESLERREMLAGDTPTLIRPEYFLVGDTSGEELVDPPFVVSTEYGTDGTPTAIVQLDGSSPDYGLHELSLELRLGSAVLETQEVAVNLTKESFSSAFYRDRLRVVNDQVKSASIAEVEAWRDELGSDGVFASLGSVTTADASGDPLLESTERFATMVSGHRSLGELLSSEADRENLYVGLARVAIEIDQLDPSERSEAIRAELGRSALLVGETLEQDLADNGPLGEKALAARDAMLSVVSPYYTVLGVYGVNTDLSRTPDGAFVESAVAVVEEGVFTLGDRLRVDLGEFNAFVGATITGNGQAWQSSPQMLATAATILDATWQPFVTEEDEGYSSGANGLTVQVVGSQLAGSQAIKHGRFQVDLSMIDDGLGNLIDSEGKVPTSATLRLKQTAGEDPREDIQLRSGWDAWDIKNGGEEVEGEDYWWSGSLGARAIAHSWAVEAN